MESMRRAYLLLAMVLPLSAQVKFTEQPGRMLVEIDGKPYSTFFLSPDGNKPYVWPLRTATGLIVTRRFPMEKFPGETSDHPHQRGMFFSHGDINGVNFWATEPGSGIPRMGSMALQRVEVKGGEKSGTIHAVFNGRDPAGKPIMEENRTLTFYSGALLRIIDYEIVVKALDPLIFADTKEGTFGIRLATSMTEDKGGHMVNAQGAQTEKNVWGKRSEWVDCYGPVEGQTAGVAVFDHPGNPRHPTYWHARAYGLLAANIFGVRDFTGAKTRDGSMKVEAGRSVRFRYRVVIHPGDPQSAKIAELYREYAGR